jgi:mannose-6-phosphate isomerase-like protein (cupin superfamily)
VTAVRITNLDTAPIKEMKNDRGYDRLLVDGDQAEALNIYYVNLKPGRGLGPYHYHEHSENLYVVLSGTIEAVVDGVRHVLGPRDVIFIPKGAPHQTGNAGDGPAEALEVYAPPRGTDSHMLDDPTDVRDASA